MFTLPTQPSKVVDKNMLKAWNFTKNKLLRECFDINLRKIFRTTSLDNCTGQRFLIVALRVDLYLTIN